MPSDSEDEQLIPKYEAHLVAKKARLESMKQALEAAGYELCKKPVNFDNAMNGLQLYMRAPDGDVVILTEAYPQSLKTDAIIDLRTGRPTDQRGYPFSEHFVPK